MWSCLHVSFDLPTTSHSLLYFFPRLLFHSARPSVIHILNPGISQSINTVGLFCHCLYFSLVPFLLATITKHVSIPCISHNVSFWVFFILTCIPTLTRLPAFPVTVTVALDWFGLVTINKLVSLETGDEPGRHVREWHASDDLVWSSLRNAAVDCWQVKKIH